MGKKSDRSDAIQIRELLTHQDESYLEMGGMLLESLDEKGVLEYLVKDIQIIDRGFELPNTFKRSPNKNAVKEVLLGTLSEFQGESEIIDHKRSQLQHLDVAYLEEGVRVEGLVALQSLRIFNLPKEEALFSLARLTELQVLEIYTGPELRDVSSITEGQQLRRVVLCNLPQLNSLDGVVSNDNLEEVVIANCPNVSVDEIVRLNGLSQLKKLRLPGREVDEALPASLLDKVV